MLKADNNNNYNYNPQASDEKYMGWKHNIISETEV